MAQFAGCPPLADPGGFAGGPELAADVSGVQGSAGPGGEYQVLVIPSFPGVVPVLVLALFVEPEGVGGHVGQGQGGRPANCATPSCP